LLFQLEWALETKAVSKTLRASNSIHNPNEEPANKEVNTDNRKSRLSQLTSETPASEEPVNREVNKAGNPRLSQPTRAVSIP